MDHKLLLVKSITLLYRESQLPNQTENSADLVKSIIALIKPPEGVMMADTGRDVISSLRTTVLWMANNPINYPYDKNELLQRLKVNTGIDEGLFEAFKAGVIHDLNDNEIKKVCAVHTKTLGTYLSQTRVKEIFKGAYTKTHFQDDQIDWNSYVAETIEQLSAYANMGEAIKHASVVNDIMLTDFDAVRNAFTRTLEETDPHGVMRFGLQGLNRMFGHQGGAKRGQLITIGGLQHKYKSGMALDMFKGTALYNKPYMRDPQRKPLLMRMSMENPLETDIMHLYKTIVEAETGLQIVPETVNTDEATAYIIEKLSSNGYNINMSQIDPSEYTYHDMFNRVKELEADGYEVHQINCDYLNMISKKGCAQGPMGVEIRDLYRRVRNFMVRRGITFITPHQLSSDAKSLVRQGVSNFVQEIANKGYYDGCRSIDQEIDVEIYVHIEKVNGESYLTIQRGKHRGLIIPTPDKDLYTVYRFNQIGGIIDDINGKDMSRRAVGGSPVSEGGDLAWFTGI